MKLVYSAILASNAHNSQPWRFRLAGDTITISADAERHIGSFDPFRREMHLSIGCALENLHQAAHAQGLEVRMELPPGMMALGALPASPAAIVRLGKGKQDETELFRAIPHRHTHRGRYCLDRHVPDELLAEFYAAVPENPSIRLFLFAGSDKEGLANLIVSATKAIVEDRQMSRDNARWFRFAQDAVEQKRDGLTLDANVTAPLQNFAAKIFPPSPESADRHWLQDTEKIQLGTAPLLGMIAVRDLYDRPTALQAGRLWQRLHLLLTARGLAGQPLNQPVERVDRERELDLPHQMAEALAQFTRDAAWLPTFIFRVGYAARPPSVSPRRPVESVVTFARRENSAKADMPTGSVARFHDG
ncbi:Acg family FMN-binding oxidoreductase [Neomesorhizobium albiziae]|uniref:Acg family FMN-binding oxidoreductase n=1 Tax=Neomesorhizobium albiziae TaxID=335020 RepID=UPI00122D0209|nr:hypothetical protein [Mesorhizobium albiziae]GLS28441.1 hypothetical protein GCM10007937_01480 [Mesorhizobium albiziae]